MRHILVIGAGKSTSVLISYLLDKSIDENLFITIGDIDLQLANKIAGNHPRCKATLLNIFEKENREVAISQADIVISMLPARFHMEVARDCIKFNKNLVTASYVSKEMRALDAEVKSKGSSS